MMLLLYDATPIIYDADRQLIEQADRSTEWSAASKLIDPGEPGGRPGNQSYPEVFPRRLDDEGGVGVPVALRPDEIGTKWKIEPRWPPKQSAADSASYVDNE